MQYTDKFSLLNYIFRLQYLCYSSFRVFIIHPCFLYEPYIYIKTCSKETGIFELQEANNYLVNVVYMGEKYNKRCIGIGLTGVLSQYKKHFSFPCVEAQTK